MPHLVVRGVSAEALRSAAPALVQQLAELCDCGTDNFTVSGLHTTAAWGGAPDEPSFAFVEVGWFERGNEIRNRFARLVTESLMPLGLDEVEVVFVTYREEAYYINGSAVNEM